MNFMCGFFLKKYNQGNSFFHSCEKFYVFSHPWKKSQIFNRDSCKNLLSVVNNMQYHLFTMFSLSGPFAEFGFVFIDFITYFRY
jgi:hypothetical protein